MSENDFIPVSGFHSLCVSFSFSLSISHSFDSVPSNVIVMFSLSFLGVLGKGSARIYIFRIWWNDPWWSVTMSPAHTIKFMALQNGCIVNVYFSSTKLFIEIWNPLQPADFFDLVCVCVCVRKRWNLVRFFFFIFQREKHPKWSAFRIQWLFKGNELASWKSHLQGGRFAQ